MGVEGPFPVMAGMASKLAINPSSCRESRRAKSSSTFSKKEFEKWPVRGTKSPDRKAGAFSFPQKDAVTQSQLVPKMESMTSMSEVVTPPSPFMS